MEFEWDDEKAAINEAKHKVTFAEAATVFTDWLSDTNPDFWHSFDEERFLTIGKSAQDRILVVSHTDREGKIRLISAREATPAERRGYEDG